MSAECCVMNAGRGRCVKSFMTSCFVRMIAERWTRGEGREQEAGEGRKQKAEGRRQKAGGRRQKAEGRRQKAGDDSTRCAREIEAGGTPAVPVFAFCGSSYELRHSTRCPLTLDFGHWILDLTRQNLNGFLIRL